MPVKSHFDELSLEITWHCRIFCFVCIKAPNALVSKQALNLVVYEPFVFMILTNVMSTWPRHKKQFKNSPSEEMTLAVKNSN